MTMTDVLLPPFKYSKHYEKNIFVRYITFPSDWCFA